jgi:hypothetical protein
MTGKRGKGKMVGSKRTHEEMKKAKVKPKPYVEDLVEYVMHNA